MSSLAPLRLVPFRMLLAGRAVNALGNSFAPIALAFAVLDLTGSATDLGLVVGARMLVNVLFLLFGGALADRLPKNLLMVGANVAAAATQGVVAFLVLSGAATVPLLIGLSALNGMTAALSMPASASIVPALVPPDLRQQANGLGRLIFNGAAVIGAPVAGIVVAAVGPGWGITVDAVAFLIAAGFFALVRIPDSETVPGRTGIFADLRDGWSAFAERTWLWVVVAGFCVLNATWSGGMFVLGPLIADDTIGRRAWGFVLAAETVGMILGAIVAMQVRVRRLLHYGVLCTAAMALPILALGVSPYLGVLLASSFLAGAALEQFGIAWETTMQEHVPAEKLARVYSYDMVGSYVAIPIGQVAVGPIADAAGIEPTMIGAAVVMLLTVVAMAASRDVRHLVHKLDGPVPATVEQSSP